MKIRYLGTAAAEGIPAMFCTCASCMQARATKKRDFRSRTQALINDDLIVDFPADAHWHELRDGLEYSKIYNYIITHAHSDHFYPADFENVDPPFAKNGEDWPIFNLYGSEDLQPEIDKAIPERPDHLAVHVLKPYETTKIGRYEVTALKARHGTPHPYNYMISDGESTMLYLHDGGAPFDETWAFFRENSCKFDLISFDFTEGMKDRLNYDGHMCMGQNNEVRDRMKAEGMITDKTILIANHFSHGGVHTNWEEDHALYEAEGYVMTYDGIEFEF